MNAQICCVQLIDSNGGMCPVTPVFGLHA